MVKWADYLISAVLYDSEHSHMEKVRVHEQLCKRRRGIQAPYLKYGVCDLKPFDVAKAKEKTARKGANWEHTQTQRRFYG